MEHLIMRVLMRLVELFLNLLIFILAVFVTAGVFIGGDGRLDRIVAQQHFCIPVQIIETSRFRPVQPFGNKKHR